jgi:hypothetical protein
MSDLVNVNLPATFSGFGGGGDDGFGFVAGATGGPRASYLRFNGKTGQYTLNGEPIAPGMRLIVGKATAAFVRLSPGEKPERVYQEPDKPPVRREDLPDRDSKLWGTFAGQPKDPWNEEVSLYTADPETGELVIFTAMSVSARNAVSDLCRLIDFQRRQKGPNVYPIVEFGVSSFTGKYGITQIPKLTIMGWSDGATELPSSKVTSATAEAQSAIKPTAKSTMPPTRKKREPPPWGDNDLNDELPS